jgi:hypothetical protein
VSSFLLTAEQTRRLRQGTADDAAIRAALFNRRLPSMLEEAWRVFMPAQAPGILLWIQDASVQYVPEQQLTTGLRIRPEKLQDVPAVVHRSSPNAKRGWDGKEAARRVLTVRPRTQFVLTGSSAANSPRTGQNRSFVRS